MRRSSSPLIVLLGLLLQLELLLRNLERRDGRLASLLLPGADGLVLRERFLLPGRVTEHTVGHRELVVGDVVLGVERDGFAQVDDRGLRLPRREQHPSEAELGLLEIGIVCYRFLEETLGLVEVPRLAVALPELVRGRGVRGVES